MQKGEGVKKEAPNSKQYRKNLSLNSADSNTCLERSKKLKLRKYTAQQY
jgi:hypothetical protein